MTQELRSIAAILASTFFMMVGVGLGGVLIPLRASLEQWPSTDIAWIGSSYALAFTAGCILTPRLVKRAGHIRVFAVLQTLLGAALLLHALVVHPLAWCLFRGLVGLTLSGGYMIVESWLNEKLDNTNRGRIFSAYMIISMAGIAAGQYLIPLADIGTPTLFMIGALTFSLSMIPILMTTTAAPRPLTRVSINPRLLFSRSPAAIVGSFLAGVIASNWSYFGPLYGQSAGLSSVGIATMLTAAMLGGVVFQFPLGWLSDKIDRRYVMSLAGAIGVVISIIMVILTPHDPVILSLGMFFLGSVLFPIYSLNVAHANDLAQPEEFVEVAGGLLIIYGVGGMIGPQLGGRMIDATGPSGFFIAMGMTYALYGLYAFWRTLRTSPIDPALRPDFQPLTLTPTQTPETFVRDARTAENMAEAETS